MLQQNIDEFNKMNLIKWHDKGFRGQGSTVVVLDSAHKPYEHTQVIDPFNDNIDRVGHKSHVAQTIREIAPEANIVVFSWFKAIKQEIINWIKEHEREICAINCSFNTSVNTDVFELLEDVDIPIIVSSGNDTKDTVGSGAKYSWTVAVGAWQEYRDNRARYSNYGEELDLVAYTNIYITTRDSGKLMFNGTSCAAPVVTGLLAIYNGWLMQQGLLKLTREQAYDFLTTNTLDKLDDGFDFESGHGLAVLPDVPEVVEEEKVGDKMRLILDAGHGAKDTGAFHGGYMEKDLNLILAKRVRVLLNEYNPKMTRTQDIQLVWDQRAALVKDKYDICLSFHLNAAPGEARGVEAIHSIYSTRGKEIAENIVEEIHSLGIPKRPRPVYSRKNSSGGDYYYMHRLTGSTTTVIIESLFLDSDLDKLFLNIEKLAQAIAKGFRKYMGQVPVETPKDNPRTIARYGSYVHVFETTKAMKVDADLGQRWRLETVGDIISQKLSKGEKVLAGINGGFFNFNGSSEHLGLYIDDGLYYSPPSGNFVDFIYYKDGTTEIRNMDGYDKVELSRLQNEAHWAIGTSYCLVKDGKVNLMNTDKFVHSQAKHPRTMIGQKADGTFVLAVADGRSATSAGLTAKEQAQVMLDLGCVNAVNLDGGGSSTMVVVRGGKPILYNSPSDFSQRKVGSVILVKEV